MIEQTELIVNRWAYTPPQSLVTDWDKLISSLSLEVMKKRASTKKGIACRFTCTFVYENVLLLEYVASDSYVIDLPDVIDLNELYTMVRNSYHKYKEKFDLRKLGTVLQDKTLVSFNETLYDMDPVLALLNE